MKRVFYDKVTSQSIQNKWIRDLTQNDDFSVEVSKGDGNCFYYSIVNALDKQYTVKELRNIVISHITEDDYNDFKMFAFAGEPQYQYILTRELDTYDRFRKFMRTKDYFADEVSIEIIQKELDLSFIIINKTTNNIQRMVQNNNRNKHTRFIILEYEDEIHYNLITYNGEKVFYKKEIPKKIQELDNNYKRVPVNKTDIINDKYLGQRLLWVQDTNICIEAVVIDYNPKNLFKFEIYNKTTKEKYWVSESFIQKNMEPFWYMPMYMRKR
jgi:hypothetical protein